MKTKRTGFTLIELMVVVAIIGILSAIAIMNYQNVKTKTQAAQIANNLHHIEDAIIEAIIEGKTVADFKNIDSTNIESSILAPYLSLGNLKEVPRGIKIAINTSTVNDKPNQFQVVVFVKGDKGTEGILEELHDMFPKNVKHIGSQDLIVIESETLALKNL